MSLGGRVNYQDDGHAQMEGLRTILQKLSERHVVTCIAAGNDFFLHRSQKGHAYSAICRESVSVGAVFDSSFGPISYGSGARAFVTGPDKVTPFSQRLSKKLEILSALLLFSFQELRSNLQVGSAPKTLVRSMEPVKQHLLLRGWSV